MVHLLIEVDELTQWPEQPFRVRVRVYNNRLIKAREDLGLTGADVERQAGLSHGTVSERARVR
jgi:hypothetical protein